MDEREERMEAADRTYRYYELQGVDPPGSNSEEWREMFNIKYEQVINGD